MRVILDSLISSLKEILLERSEARGDGNKASQRGRKQEKPRVAAATEIQRRFQDFSLQYDESVRFQCYFMPHPSAHGPTCRKPFLDDLLLFDIPPSKLTNSRF